jgi:hypothetical protein
LEKRGQPDGYPTHQSLSRAHKDQIRRWVEGNVSITTIHRTLVDQFEFAGCYSFIRRLAQKLHQPEATCMLDFAPVEAV